MIELDHIYNMDCLVGMQMIADRTVDAVICDLPYGVLNKDNPNAQWDSLIPLEPLWKQYKRIIKDNGAIVLFCQGMFTAQLMMSQPKLWRYNLIWYKCRSTGFLNANRMPLRNHEDIAVFYKSLPVYNPQKTIGEPIHPRRSNNNKEINNCYGKYKRGRTYDYDKQMKEVLPTQSAQKFPESVICIKKEHKKPVLHPTQKPLDLLRYLVLTYTNPGDVILDNACGSGTACLAAALEHRHYIGFETNKEYFDKAVKRINDDTRQLKLF